MRATNYKSRKGVIYLLEIEHTKLKHGYGLTTKEVPLTYPTWRTRLTIKYVLTECRQYEIQKKHNIPSQLNKIKPQIESTNEIMKFLKQANL